jgi:protease I
MWCAFFLVQEKHSAFSPFKRSNDRMNVYNISLLITLRRTVMADKKLAGMRVLMVIAPTEFRDEELLEPKKILSEAGAEVIVASTQAGAASGMLGASVQPDIVIDKAQASQFNGVVVVGGMGSPTHLWNNSHVHDLLRSCHKDAKLVAGICLSGAVLANAGVLQNKRATVYATPESLQALQSHGAKYIKEHVVIDGNVVTADGPEAASEFGHTLVEVLLRTTAKV